MLLAAGFAAPVMDMEIITFVYQGQGLLADLRASGQTCARADRPRGLPAGVRETAARRGAFSRYAGSHLRPRLGWRACANRRNKQ